MLDGDPTDKNNETKREEPTFQMDHTLDIVSSLCSCGSSNVKSMGMNASRNQDLKKGETWGVKDRGDEVINRLQCQSCGRTWIEEA